MPCNIQHGVTRTNVSLGHWGVILSSHPEPRWESQKEKNKEKEKKKAGLCWERTPGHVGLSWIWAPCSRSSPFPSWNKAELAGRGGQKARRCYKKSGHCLLFCLRVRGGPPSETSVHWGVQCRHETRDGSVGEAIAPQGPSLQGHPLFSFQPCSELMSHVHIHLDCCVELQVTWAAVHTRHQNATEIRLK